MPKAVHLRKSLHAPSAKLPESSARNINTRPVENVEIGPMAEASGPQSLQVMHPRPFTQPKKKAKQQLKHEAFMERLRGSQSPYSRSHNRRLRRKEKEQLASGMADLKAALSAIDDAVEKVQRSGITSARRRDPSKGGVSRIKLGKIGQGNGVPLSNVQRKQVLFSERLRLPLVQSTPEYSKNAFETIREHAQITLVPREIPTL